MTQKEISTTLKNLLEWLYGGKNINVSINDVKNALSYAITIVDKDSKDITKSVYDTDSSVRLLNAIRFYDGRPHPLRDKDDYGDIKIFHLKKISKKEFSKQRNVGKRTLKELEELCKYYDIKLLP